MRLGSRLIIMIMETRLAAKFEHRLAAKWPRILATQLLRYVFGILGLYFIDKLKNIYELKSVNLKSSFMEYFDPVRGRPFNVKTSVHNCILNEQNSKAMINIQRRIQNEFLGAHNSVSFPIYS